MAVFTNMTSKRQLTIPRRVRDEWNSTPGTRFFVTACDGKIVARPKNRRLADLPGMPGNSPSGEILTIEQMNEAAMDAAAEDDEWITCEWNEAHK
jgi:antitoxin PrlF